MREFLASAFTTVILILLTAGCSGAASPTLPQGYGREAPTSEVTSNAETPQTESAGHSLWFYELIYFDLSDPERIRFETIPVRLASAHWNVLSWLEQAPCTNCFQLTSLTPSGNGTLLADIEVTHPFANPNLTGFDVRGIAMFNASHTFPESGLTFSDRTAYDGAVVNPDGFTTLYNATTAGSGPNGLQGYLKGELATATAPNALLNAYKKFISVDPANTRNAFYAGDTITVTYEIDMPDPPNPFVLGYAVDASWVSAINKPVTDPMADFPPEANCPEPWLIEVTENPVGQGLTNQGGATVLALYIFDWQGKATLLPPRVECPELFNGYKTATWVLDGAGVTRYDATIQNENLAPAQTYNCLIIAEDTANAGSPDWLDLTAYQVVELEVIESDDQSPVPLAIFLPDPPTVCEAIEFSDNGSFDPDGGSIILYEWDWDNDGIYDEEGTSVSHTWNTVGEYTIGFRVTDDENSMGTTYLDFKVQNGLPIASASADKSVAFIGESIVFDGSASIDQDCGGESITEYAWDWEGDFIFDDYGEIVSHSFSINETQYVSLRVTDNESETDLTDTAITIDVNNGWARTWGAVSDQSVRAVAVDSLGNIYALGTFTATVDFDPSSAVLEMSSNGSQDIFLSKFTPDGNLLWVNTWGGPALDYAEAVVVNSSDDAYITGSFRGTMDLDPSIVGSVPRTSNGDWDIFMVRMDSAGAYSWGFSVGGAEYDEGRGLALDKASSVLYLVGCYRDTVDFDPNIAMEDFRTSNGLMDIFLSKFDANTNTYFWTQTWGGSEDDESMAVAVDTDGRTYVTGYYKDTVDFSPGGGVVNHTSNGMQDVFLSLFQSTGVFGWAKSWGSLSTDIGYSVTASPVLSECWVAGVFAGTVDFDPGVDMDNRTSNGALDAFCCGYTGGGSRNFSATWGGSGTDYVLSISYHSDPDKIALTGSFEDVVDFDPGAGAYERTSNGDEDAYLLYSSWNGTFNWVDTWGGSQTDRGYGAAVRWDITAPIYVGGTFEDVVDFDPQDGIDSHTSNGDRDAFLSRFPPDGQW